MTIRARLLLALGMLFATVFGAMMLALWLDGESRARAEVEASMQSAELLLRHYIDSMPEGKERAENIALLVERASMRRHVRMTWTPVSVRPEDATVTPALRALGDPPMVEPITIAVQNEGQTLGRVVLEANTADELAEVAETLNRIFLFTGGFALAAFLLTTWLINRALAPVHDLDVALDQLTDGNYGVTLSDDGPPEIVAITDRVRRLAQRLDMVRAENRELSRTIVRIQDDERRDIARELHDEFGPFLFSIRASVTALNNTLAKPTHTQSDVAALTTAISSHIDALQLTNRRILSQLAPDGLQELGLSRSLEAMAETWRGQQLGPQLELDIAGGIDQVDSTTALTTYRIAQEALTNAYRHAGAKNIVVSVTMQHRAPPHADDQSQQVIDIRVQDDGQGFSTSSTNGFGLRGMRERVAALGGTLTVTSDPQSGTELAAALPLYDQQRDGRSDAATV